MNDNDFKINFGNRLKNLRIEYSYTQKQIADFLNITLRAYQYYESGQRFPPVENIIALAQKYKIKFEKVLYCADDEVEIPILFEDKDSQLYKEISNTAQSLGISTENFITYILTSYAFNAS